MTPEPNHRGRTPSWQGRARTSCARRNQTRHHRAGDDGRLVWLSRQRNFAHSVRLRKVVIKWRRELLAAALTIWRWGRIATDIKSGLTLGRCASLADRVSSPGRSAPSQSPSARQSGCGARRWTTRYRRRDHVRWAWRIVPCPSPPPCGRGQADSCRCPDRRGSGDRVFWQPDLCARPAASPASPPCAPRPWPRRGAPTSYRSSTSSPPNIRNPNTRRAYGRAAMTFFDWLARRAWRSSRPRAIKVERVPMPSAGRAGGLRTTDDSRGARLQKRDRRPSPTGPRDDGSDWIGLSRPAGIDP